MLRLVPLLILLSFSYAPPNESAATWIRINQLGYTPEGVKVAVWCSKKEASAGSWQLVDAQSRKVVYSGTMGKAYGAYGPFIQTYRLHFTGFSKPGRYYLQAGKTRSPEFRIADDVYRGAADFCLRYMRQQRTGFNPFLKDSCHTHDGYLLYGGKAGIPDSTRMDVVGGWHDASDYLQYTTTSANATYHLLAAYRDFPNVFADEKQANGLDGRNGIADVMDEAKWGLDWLLKMHPRKDWMFNQIADDRDHMGMRIPGQDTFYGRGFERPVYFVSGEPQQRGKFMNNSTGTSSTAGKLSSAFALGAMLFRETDSSYTDLLVEKAFSAYGFGWRKPGVSQTASVKSPYIYAEDNWTDDMELAAVSLHQLANSRPGNRAESDFLLWESLDFARREKITPWLGTDTAKHYQWYPFINLGHYALAKAFRKSPGDFGSYADTAITYYQEGIQRVWNKASSNAFYRGIPFIWCSNNLTTSFAIQCYWYRMLTGDKTFEELEQACFDWLFGCNPWGTGMVYGLPAWGDTPVDPHSAFTHLGKYPIDGGLVDGPVYGSIYNNLIGIRLYEPDEYAAFQSGLAVYHDDYGDYSTNEPTMDGTASLIYLLAAREAGEPGPPFSQSHGAIIRGNTGSRNIALVFTGDEFADGGKYITGILEQQKVKASFFLTGRFYENKDFKELIRQLKEDGHWLGPHSHQHLLYNDWKQRDRLLVTKQQFREDLGENLRAMGKHGINLREVNHFLPPFEWYNDSIAAWSREMGLQLVNFSPGTLSHADYTVPGEKNYRSSREIYASILEQEQASPVGLNGFILLMHVGTNPARTDKFYHLLPDLLKYLKEKGYQFQSIDALLAHP